MKKFKFRLQKVLDYRETQKEELLRTLAQKNARVIELKAYLTALEEAERNNLLASGDAVAVEFVHLVGNFAHRLQEAIVGTRVEILKAEEEAQEALAVYLEKLKEVKSLVALKDKRHQEYRDLELKEDTKFLDELATHKGNTFYVEEQS